MPLPKDQRIEKKTGYFQKDNPNGLTVYIGNLLYSKNEHEIKALFEKFGAVKYVKIVVEPKTGKSKGIAFVQMANKKDALVAIEKLNGKEYDGRTLKVSIANERENIERPKPRKKAEASSDALKDMKTRGGKKPRRPKGLDVLFKNLKKK